PVITEDTTSLVEKIILNRIRSKAWDDVERVVKPNVNPYEYKKKLLLDQEKSKKSLAEIYEEEYLKQQKKDTDKEEEFPEHTDIREKMEEIFTLLDALSNYHYTPNMASAEVKIQSNMPAVTMEEATPISVTDASLLAPQEILAAVRGELQGKTELTQTDKKRERRHKKSIQKKKAQAQEQKLRENLKRAGNGRKLDAKTTLNVVKKAVKSGQVKLLDGQQHKVVKSSQSFFKQLQESTKVNVKGKKLDKNKKNNCDGKFSASKLLL
ncbi:u3 small nucleolar ribonucleoprotein MPP10, partial [Halocaridina rubra]